jgi:hypothetical protein
LLQLGTAGSPAVPLLHTNGLLWLSAAGAAAFVLGLLVLVLDLLTHT